MGTYYENIFDHLNRFQDLNVLEIEYDGIHEFKFEDVLKQDNLKESTSITIKRCFIKSSPEKYFNQIIEKKISFQFEDCDLDSLESSVLNSSKPEINKYITIIEDFLSYNS